jgi:hypothetical protein
MTGCGILASLESSRQANERHPTIGREIYRSRNDPPGSQDENIAAIVRRRDGARTGIADDEAYWEVSRTLIHTLNALQWSAEPCRLRTWAVFTR